MVRLEVAILGVFILACMASSQEVRKTGQNVCCNLEQRKDTVTVPKVVKIEKIPCFDSRQNYMCNRKLTKMVKETKIVNFEACSCCTGWEPIGEECTKAICPGGCGFGSDCIAPGVCSPKLEPAEPAEPVKNLWTKRASGCMCYFDHSRIDCACCDRGACQCPYDHADKCVQCGYVEMCEDIYDSQQSQGVDGWTLAETGCSCDGSSGPGICPCCQNGGCPCPNGGNRCTQCGLPDACGNP